MDEVSDIIKDSIEHSIGSQLYQQNMVNKWTDSVVENCLTSLCKLAKPFKYIGKKHRELFSLMFKIMYYLYCIKYYNNTFVERLNVLIIIKII